MCVVTQMMFKIIVFFTPDAGSEYLPNHKIKFDNRRNI